MADQSSPNHVWILTLNESVIGTFSTSELANLAHDLMEHRGDISELSLTLLDVMPVRCWDVRIKPDFVRGRIVAMSIEANGHSWTTTPETTQWGYRHSISINYPMDKYTADEALALANERWTKGLKNEFMQRMNPSDNGK